MVEVHIYIEQQVSPISGGFFCTDVAVESA